MKTKSIRALINDPIFHTPKLPYLNSRSAINSTHQMDKLLSKRFKTESKFIEEKSVSGKKQLKRAPRSYKILPKLQKSESQEILLVHHEKAIKILKKHQPGNSSKSLLYSMRTEGEKQFNKIKKDIQPSQSVLFRDKSQKVIKKLQIQSLELDNPEKPVVVKKRKSGKKDLVDKVLNIRNLSKKLKQKSDRLYRKFDEINQYTNQQYDKLCKKNKLTKKYVERKISNSSIEQEEEEKSKQLQ